MTTETIWMLKNEHASVHLFDLAFSPEDEGLLVCAVVASTSVALLKAIKAQLEKNGNNLLSAVGFGAERQHVVLRGAGRGYLYHAASLLPANVRGHAAVFLHKAAGDPRAADDSFCYVVATQADDVTAMFVERLRVASIHAVRDRWGQYLLEVGTDRGLVGDLEMRGTGEFLNRALRLKCDDEAWGQVISDGLRSKAITLA